ncbi:MAG: hypothetical protein JO128_15335 [Alphaproteobacteria bacterium]|nr:hypothetical protein [Alphaproteobacteria bacterium]
MRQGLLVAGIAAWLVACASLGARADTCETYPGSQVYTDQGCDRPYDNGNRNQQRAAPPAQQKPSSDLREQLRRALSNPANSGKTSTSALANAVANARDGVQRALGEAATASDPQGLAKAQRDYTAALARLDRAYDAAANAASPDGAAELQDMKNRDDSRFGSAADRLGLLAPAPVQQPAPAASAPVPANIAATNGFVYVCDSAVAGGNNVSCREISADGGQCTNVTLADGNIGWRDSVATPCRSDDMAQRQAFLAANPAIAAAVNGTTPSFTMDNKGTADAIAKLSGQPVDPEAEKALARMSPECRDTLQRYIAAAQANDGPGATAQYAAMKQAGGCGVLPKPDPRFISRGSTPALDQTFGACDQQPELCAQIADQLKAGTSPEAIAALYNNAIGIGLQLGSMMGGALLNAQAARMPTGGPNRAVSGPARGPSRQYPPATACNNRGCSTPGNPGPVYNPAPPRPGRGANCTMDANNWLTCN